MVGCSAVGGQWCEFCCFCHRRRRCRRLSAGTSVLNTSKSISCARPLHSCTPATVCADAAAQPEAAGGESASAVRTHRRPCRRAALLRAVERVEQRLCRNVHRCARLRHRLRSHCQRAVRHLPLAERHRRTPAIVASSVEARLPLPRRSVTRADERPGRSLHGHTSADGAGGRVRDVVDGADDLAK